MLNIPQSEAYRVQAMAALELRRRRQRYKPPPPPFAKYEGNSAGFFTDVLELSLTDEQIELCNKFDAENVLNVKAGHGVGKTYLVGGFVIYWVFAVAGLAITTAPTGRQVKKLLWKEIRRFFFANRDKFPGSCDLTQLKFREGAEAYGFAARDTNTDAFQGIHEAKLLVIEDEANGISEAIDDGALSVATGADNKIVRIGNPTEPDTPFHGHCKRSCVTIPVWTHPNVAWAYEEVKIGDDDDAYFTHRLKPKVAKAIIGEDGKVLPQSQWPKWCPRDVIPGAVSVKWIEDRREDKGETSPYWTSRLNAEFPEDSEDALVPRAWFKDARARYDENPEYWDKLVTHKSWQHGVDVGDGGDPHAIASRRGPVLYFVKEYKTRGDRKDVLRAATYAKATNTIRPGVILVDRTGVGAGTLNHLLELEQPAVGVNFGEGASDKELFVNRRAEILWNIRELLRKGELAIAPLGDETEEELMREMSAVKWEQLITEKIKIEKKEETIKRLGRSPDLLDAFAMAFADFELVTTYEGMVDL